ncbi:UNVERIFIED_ORG: ABC-type polar amino acid transport system ATPase subunit [Arthrobacter sp. UYCu721]
MHRRGRSRPPAGDSALRTIVSMSRVIFMCGPAGSGKSAVARRLATEGKVRLSFDEVAWQMGLRIMPVEEGVRRQVGPRRRFPVER